MLLFCTGQSKNKEYDYCPFSKAYREDFPCLFCELKSTNQEVLLSN